MKLDLTTQVVLYTKTNGPCTLVTCTLTINTTVLTINHQAHQGGLKREDKESMRKHLTNTWNSPLGGSLTYNLGCSLGYPLTTALLTTALVIWLYDSLHKGDPYSRWPFKSNCHFSACTTYKEHSTRFILRSNTSILLGNHSEAITLKLMESPGS